MEDIKYCNTHTKMIEKIDLLNKAALEDNTLILEGTITQGYGSEILTLLKMIEEKYSKKKDKTKKVNVFIDSSGGDIPTGVRIYDALSNSKLEVCTLIGERAHGIAGIIFLAGKERLMMHYSEWSFKDTIANAIIENKTENKKVSEYIIDKSALNNRIKEIIDSHFSATDIFLSNMANKPIDFFEYKNALDYNIATGKMDKIWDPVIRYNSEIDVKELRMENFLNKSIKR